MSEKKYTNPKYRELPSPDTSYSSRKREHAKKLLEKKRLEIVVFKKIETCYSPHEHDHELNDNRDNDIEKELRLYIATLVNEEQKLFGGIMSKFQTRKESLDSFGDGVRYDLIFDDNRSSSYERLAYKKLFDFTPKGSVKLEFLSTSIFVLLDSESDYENAFASMSKFNKTEMIQRFNPAYNTSGFKLHNRQYDIDVTVGLRPKTYNKNGSSAKDGYEMKKIQTIKKHEEAHSFNGAIFNVERELPADSETVSLLSRMSAHETKEGLSGIIHAWAQPLYWRGLSELLCYTRARFDHHDNFVSSVLDKERGEDVKLYDYFGDDKALFDSLCESYIKENSALNEAEKKQLLQEAGTQFILNKRNYEQFITRLGNAISRFRQNSLENTSDDDLYICFALEAAKSKDINEFINRCEMLADAAQVE